MDRKSEEIIKVLHPMLGDAAGMMYVRELQHQGIRFLSEASVVQEKNLVDDICTHLILPVCSERRTALLRSRLYSILGMSSYASSKSDIEGLNWG